MTRKSIFQGDIKGEDQIFWNPAGSPMSNGNTEGKENLNLSFFLRGNANDFVRREDIGDALFDAIKAVICIGGTWCNNGGYSEPGEEARDYMEFYITKKELRGIERAVREGKK
jgi:hypothetical protein